MLFKLHMIHRFWRFRLRKEKFELAVVRNAELAGSLVLDIGANKGVYSYWMSRAVGQKGRVIAFEPQPELQSQLARVKSTFNLDNVQIVNKALSDEPGKALLFRDFSGAGHASIDREEGRAESIEIEKIRLDDFAKENLLENVAFIKIDVEGHELATLRGGEKLLRLSQPLLLFECHLAAAEEGSTFRFLESLGYDGFYFTDQGLCHYKNLVPIAQDNAHCNFVFGPKDTIIDQATNIGGMEWMPNGNP